MIRTLFPRPWQIRAALDGRLSAVAVRLKEQPAPSVGPEFSTHWHWQSKSGVYLGAITLPFAPGDLLVCKEAYTIVPTSAYRGVQQTINPHYRHTAAIYKAGWDRSIPQWKSPVTMPRWASRMTWEVESVRVCRVQDVTWEDAEAAGVWYSSQEYREQVCIWRDCAPALQRLRVKYFAKQWTADHGPDSWERNPWIGFYRINVHLCNVKEIAA